MLEFEPSAMALLAQWLTTHGVVFGAGLFVGVITTASVFVTKLVRLRRDGVL